MATTVRFFVYHDLVLLILLSGACIYDDARASGLLYTYNKGHEIGSHTWSHSDLSTLTFDQVHDEMWRVECTDLSSTSLHIS
jgi:peptidoglycan/xylan/chitin deacetylase (PgdA/CDA1 family)